MVEPDPGWTAWPEAQTAFGAASDHQLERLLAPNGDLRHEICGSTISQTERPDDPQFIYHQMQADPHRVYRLLHETFDDRLRCDVSPYTIAIGGDGLSRSVYGEGGRYAIGAGRNQSDFNTRLDQHRREAMYQADRILDRLDLYIRERANRCAASAELCETGPVRLLVFAHGGMVTHENAVRSAEVLAPAMLADGYFPVFLVWNSDFPNAYVNQLCCINQRAEPSRYAQRLAIPVRLFGDVGGGLVRLPQNVLTQAERFGRSVEPSSTDDPLYYLPEYCLEESCRAAADQRNWARSRAMQNRYRIRSFEADLDVHAFEEGRQPDGQTRLDPVVIFPPFTTAEDLNDTGEPAFQRGFRYGALAPVRGLTSLGTEGGANAWNNMVRRARLSVFVGEDFAGTQFAAPEINPDKKACTDPERYYGLGGFGVFFERLLCARNATFFAETAPAEIEITFVGHSMGAIVGNEVLREYGESLPFQRIVYMAAASSIREFEDAVIPVMQRRPTPYGEPLGVNGIRRPVSFYNLMLHPLAESRELPPAENSWTQGTLPQGSLLEWIDEYFERPRSAVDRTLGKWSNVWRVLEYLSFEARGRMAFTVFGMQTGVIEQDYCADTERCHPRIHGQFDDYSFWRPAFLTGGQLQDPEATAEVAAQRQREAAAGAGQKSNN